MNRHYLREQDFEPDAVEEDEPEPELNISRHAMLAIIWVGIPCAFMFAFACWYGIYRIGKFMYYLAASSIASFTI